MAVAGLSEQLARMNIQSTNIQSIKKGDCINSTPGKFLCQITTMYLCNLIYTDYNYLTQDIHQITRNATGFLSTYRYAYMETEQQSHIPETLLKIRPNRELDRFYIGKSTVKRRDRYSYTWLDPERWQVHKHEYDIMIVLYESSHEQEILNLEEGLINFFVHDPKCVNKLPYHPGRPGSAVKYALYVCIGYRETVNYDYFVDLEARSQSSTLDQGPIRQKAINVLVDAIDRFLQEHRRTRSIRIQLTYGPSKLFEQLKLLMEGNECMYILAMMTLLAIPNICGLHETIDLIEYAASLERALNYHYRFNEQNDHIQFTRISKVEIPEDEVCVSEAFLYLQVL